MLLLLTEISRTKLSFQERGELAKNSVAKKLFSIMSTKETNLCVAADLTNQAAILNLVEAIGPFICLLKTHIDIVEDFNPKFIDALKDLAKKYNFLLMEDRKFADIGNTVALQYGKGVYKIAEWADLVTAHSLPGPAILKGLSSVVADKENDRGVFLLAELSSADTLIGSKYAEDTISVATGTQSGLVTGIVCQTKTLITVPGLIQLTPGVKIDDVSDNLGQQYNTPEYVVSEKGADIAVVGRGIIEAKCPQTAAKLYRDRLWAAYIKRIA